MAHAICSKSYLTISMLNTMLTSMHEA
jgi:hypothetical protein